MPFLDRCLLAGRNFHGAPCCLRAEVVANLVANMGLRGIGGDIDCSVRQQLPGSYSHFPEFESLCLVPGEWVRSGHIGNTLAADGL